MTPPVSFSIGATNLSSQTLEIRLVGRQQSTALRVAACAVVVMAAAIDAAAMVEVMIRFRVFPSSLPWILLRCSSAPVLASLGLNPS